MPARPHAPLRRVAHAPGYRPCPRGCLELPLLKGHPRPSAGSSPATDGPGEFFPKRVNGFSRPGPGWRMTASNSPVAGVASGGAVVRPPQRTMWAMSSASAAAGATGLADGQRDAVIHTEDLTKIYAGTDFAAVDRLNLDVEAGEIFGLLGPNGAGKTTTAGMLTTRVVPTSGRAFLG